MAVTFSGNFSSSTAYMQLKATYNLVSQDIANNRSTVDYHIYLQSTGGWPYANGSFNLELKKDNVVYRNVPISSYALSANGTFTLATGSITVDHYADGNKTAWLEAYFVSAHGNAYAAGNYTLTSIPRMSDLILLNVYNATITSATYGQTIRFSINKASGSFTSTIRYGWNGNTGTIVSKTSATTYDYVIPNSWMTYIPNDTSTWGTFYIDTYSGTTLIGTKSVTLTTIVPDTVVPTFTSMTVSEATTSPNVSAVTGGTTYLQNASTLKFTFNGATQAYGSAISSYKVSVDGKTYNGNNAISDVFNTSGTFTATATITDSRGRSSSKTVSITIAAYSKPSLSAMSVYRTAGGLSTTVEVKATGAYTIRANNVCKYKLGYKQKGTSTYTYIAEETITASFTDKIKAFTGVTFVQSASYDIEVTLYDSLYSSTTYVSVGTAEVPLALGKNRIGIGKIPSQGVVDMKGDMYIEGALNLTGSVGGNVPRTQSANGFNGLIHPNGTNADWIRSTTNGFLPYASGGNSSSLGTTSWPWKEIHGKTMYVDGRNLGSTTAILATPAVGVWHYSQKTGDTFTYLKYWKTADNIVHLQGLAYLEVGYRNSGQVLFTLPAGYRPEGESVFSTQCSSGACRIDVLPDGKVQLNQGGTPDWISVSGIFFYQYG